MSGPSIVLERMNFKVEEKVQLEVKVQQKQIKEKVENKVIDVESREDNASDNDGKSS